MSAHQFHPYRTAHTGKETSEGQSSRQKTSNFLHHKKYVLVGVFPFLAFFLFSFYFFPYSFSFSSLTGIEQKLHTEKSSKKQQQRRRRRRRPTLTSSPPSNGMANTKYAIRCFSHFFFHFRLGQRKKEREL